MDTVDSLVNKLVGDKNSDSPGGRWQVVSKSSLKSPPKSTRSASPPQETPAKMAEKSSPKKSSRKRKRKTHKLKWSFLLETIGVKMESVKLRQASDLHCACFFHAVTKREVNYNEVRNYLKKFRILMEEKKEKFGDCKRILKLINRYLNSHEQTLPVDLWSPKEFKQCMSMVLDGNLLIVSLLQRRNDDGKDGQPSAFAIPASEINRQNGIVSEERSKSGRHLTREEELNKRYPIEFDADDIVVCERYDSEGNTQIINNVNAKMLREDYEKQKLHVLIWAKEGAMHWGFVNFKRPRAD